MVDAEQKQYGRLQTVRGLTFLSTALKPKSNGYGRVINMSPLGRNTKLRGGGMPRAITETLNENRSAVSKMKGPEPSGRAPGNQCAGSLTPRIVVAEGQLVRLLLGYSQSRHGVECTKNTLHRHGSSPLSVAAQNRFARVRHAAFVYHHLAALDHHLGGE